MKRLEQGQPDIAMPPDAQHATAAAVRDHPMLGASIRLSATFGFGLMAALSKLAAEQGVSSIEIALYRCLFALPVILLWIMLGPGLHTLRTRRPGAHALRSALGFATLLGTFTAIGLLPLATATTISFAAPLFATMFSAILLGEVVGWHRWSAVAAGLIGVAIVMRPGGGALPVAGVIVALGSALGTSLVTVTMRQITTTEAPGTIVFWFTFSTAAAAAIALPFIGHAHNPAQWLLLGGVGLTGAFMQIALTTSLRHAPVSVVAPIDYCQLIWASAFGWLIWNVVPSRNTLCGAALIAISGLYVLVREQRRKARTAQTQLEP